MDHNSMETYFACRIGLVSRVHRRLSDIERQSVRSGSVYCFDEREAGMRRWTDGKSWSPSRVTGSFLTYRELDDSQGNHTGKNVYRPDGLLKQSFSITTSDNQKLHLISYYTNMDVRSERLRNTPSQDPRFSEVVVPKGIYPETSGHGGDHSSHHAASHNSPSPPMAPRARQRPHHRAFQHTEDDRSKVSGPHHHHHHHQRNGSTSSTGGLKEHRYSPIQSLEGKQVGSRSRSNSNLAGSATIAKNGMQGQRDHRYKSSSPTATSSSFPTPPSNAYSPATSWASDDELPLVDDVKPVMIPALAELPPLNIKDRQGSTDDQDSLSVLANLATHTLLLPKLEPKEISRDRVRWVEDDRQLRALSSMLRL
ncbi:Gti1/Pac2 family transcription factor [Entomortierella parvispora]|uniref:Gti1/Pac2 family transcription factor n=1 Tax=Entomortierella parvispora TaxID=205924 RepID=A0A9P3H8R6_9FUNG|nr:Gti1/Pac2 family transcription factor [Entomortierella parvispora]